MGCVTSKKKMPIPTRISKVSDLKVQPSTFVVENHERFQDVYSIGASLGSGTFGEVRKVIHRGNHSERAVKIFRKDLATSEEKKQKLLNEIEVLKRLDHPNIVRVYEFFEDTKRFYIVMEHCKGGELFEEIIKRKSFNEVQTAQIVYQILSALAYLHDHEIVHRDIKPENILLEEKGDIMNCKLIDFGTAAFFEKGKLLRGSIGTAYYIAPEVLVGNYSEKCDLWSCGVLLFILLCGYPPFDGRNDVEIIDKVNRGHYEFKGEIWKHISTDAKDLVSSLLSPEPTRLTASEALTHPWVTLNSHRTMPNTTIMDAALKNLKNFHNTSKLRDAVNTFITTQCISQKDTKELRDVFRAMDTNGDGKLSREELLNQFSKTMGYNAASDEVDRIMAEVDTDNNGYIDYTEFLKATLDIRTVMSSENMRRAFDLFDKDGSQSISAMELKKILAGEAISENKVWESIVKEVDQNGDGEIDFSEFQQIILSKL